jgi:prophage tail gpP-like protein
VAKLALRVNGLEFAGWKEATVKRSVEAVASSFSLSVSDRWDGQTNPWPIMEEDECRLMIGAEQVITGYVDRRTISFDKEAHSLEVSGRDATGALVDCSAILRHVTGGKGKWEFRNTSLFTLTQRLCEPFGIRVSIQPGLPLPDVLEKVTVDPGESAFEVLDRACRMAGILPVSDGAGGVMLSRVGAARTHTALIEGENILTGSAEYDASKRFRKYIVRGQHAGTDEWFGEGAAGVSGEATDENVRRESRVLLVRPEQAAKGASIQKRAQWEAKVRAARSETVTVSVQGWQQSNGVLWPLNALVSVRSPSLGIDGELLISEITHKLSDNGGTVTEFDLKRPDAFIPEPVVTKHSTEAGKGGLGWKEIRKGVVRK